MVETLDPGVWRSLVVFVLFRGERRSFHLSWNHRWARSTEFLKLCDAYPSVADEITAWAEAS
jgi:hypothetical protein